MKRVFLIVLDSFGIGEAPDAAAFGDAGCSTLRAVAVRTEFCCPNLRRLGLGNIEGVEGVRPFRGPHGAYARMTEASAAKDTTVGHWEIAGLISRRPFPTYPDGFPPEVIDAFTCAVGRGVLCNKPYSGTQVIEDYGREHLESGDLIVYTSADSVFQIAAHEDLIPPQELYEICEKAREILTGEHGVGRVIARPFAGKPGAFYRTENRRDFSLRPPCPTLLDDVSGAGQQVIAVGKIRDIFEGQGITCHLPSHNNAEGMAQTASALSSDFSGLCFTNLVDFDMLYGHRRDPEGYARALTEFDRWLPAFLRGMKDDDLLMITADHGCDPVFSGTDHTREYTPLLIAGPRVRSVDLGTRATFADIAATAAQALGVPYSGAGESLLDAIL